MDVVRDKNGVYWHIDQWDHYVVYNKWTGVVRARHANFDGFTATAAEFRKVFGSTPPPTDEQKRINELELDSRLEIAIGDGPQNDY